MSLEKKYTDATLKGLKDLIKSEQLDKLRDLEKKLKESLAINDHNKDKDFHLYVSGQINGLWKVIVELDLL